MVILGPAQSTSLSLLGKSLAQLAHQLFWSIRRLYSRPGHFYWPTIRIKQCDGLLWRNPGKCVASRRCVFCQWAIVFRCTKHWCYLVGIWYLWLLEHTSCQCCECSHAQHQRSATDPHGLASVLMSDMKECPADLATNGTEEHTDAD